MSLFEVFEVGVGNCCWLRLDRYLGDGLWELGSDDFESLCFMERLLLDTAGS